MAMCHWHRQVAASRSQTFEPDDLSDDHSRQQGATRWNGAAQDHQADGAVDPGKLSGICLSKGLLSSQHLVRYPTVSGGELPGYTQPPKHRHVTGSWHGAA